MRLASGSRRLAVSSEAPRSAPDLSDVYRAHAESVSRWARRLLGPGGDVEDVLHEVFLVVQRRLPEFRGDARIGTWLYAITVRVAHERRRRDRWRRWLRLDPARDLADVPSESRSPLQELESRRALETTYRVLDRLSERDRTALILFELEGLSGEEVAAVLGQSVSTTWVRLHRARARFLKELQAMDGEGDR